MRAEIGSRLKPSGKCRLGLIAVPQSLRAIGERIERKTDHFDEDTEDTKWLTEVGARGWIILTADKNLTHNHIEIVALLKSNTHSFILTSGTFTGTEMSNAFVTAMPAIKGIIKKIPPPAVCKVSKEGIVNVAYTHDGLIKLAIETEQRELVRARDLDRRKSKKKKPP